MNTRIIVTNQPVGTLVETEFYLVPTSIYLTPDMLSTVWVGAGLMHAYASTKYPSGIIDRRLLVASYFGLPPELRLQLKRHCYA